MFSRHVHRLHTCVRARRFAMLLCCTAIVLPVYERLNASDNWRPEMRQVPFKGLFRYITVGTNIVIVGVDCRDLRL